MIKTIKKLEKTISLQKLSEKLGVSKRTIEGWKQGRTIPKTTKILIKKIEEETYDNTGN